MTGSLTPSSTLTQHLKAFLDQLNEAKARSGRSDVKLIAVSKTVPPLLVRQAYDLGLRDFGENRVQEAVKKIDATSSYMADARWHLIGHLQSNKVKAAVQRFDMIQSIDSLALARRCNRIAAESGHHVPILLEVNVAREMSKTGFSPEAVSEVLPELLTLPKLELRGLMTIAPVVHDPEDVRWVFRALRELRDQFSDRFGLESFRELSMGMSGDYAVAIDEGATMVRIGQAIFGERNRAG